jgi:ABC-type multidrug transport system ATPase subunit
MSILSGIIPPSEGEASVFGRDISQVTELRSILGLCPQHDSLFDDLTPTENLRLFAAIKGVRSDQIDQTAQSLLRQVDLEEKADSFSSTMSGGQKRKLSLALALIGNPKV